MDALINQLIDLYNASSKHSGYQVLASNYSNIINQNNITLHSRYETERWRYITGKVPVANSRILDIGGNTGFFTFEAVNAGAKHVDYYEGNALHAQFVDISTRYFELTQKITVYQQYYSFENIDTACTYDTVFLMNVLHHVGDDYHPSAKTMENAKQLMITHLNAMAEISRYIVFQLGYNWKGNCNSGLFPGGTKKELSEFILNGIQGFWEAVHIGIPERTADGIVYKELSPANCNRCDEMGEFLNRPIFILKSLRMQSNEKELS